MAKREVARVEKVDEQPTKIKEICDIPGVGSTTLEKLNANGYYDILSIAATPVAQITAATGLGEVPARKIIHIAREALDLGFGTARSLELKREKMVKITTGFKPLDELIGGGYEPGVITELFGEMSSGKTQLAHILAVNAIKQNPKNVVIYIDSESCCRPDRLRQLAEGIGLNQEIALKQVKVAHALNSDHQMLLVNKVEEMIGKGEKNIKVIIVDSIIAHFRAEFSGGMGTLAPRQQKLNKHIHDLMRVADLNGIIVLITNQVMANPGIMFGNPLSPVGGNILGHSSSVRLFLRKGKKGSRVAKLIDSPNCPDGEVNYFVEKEGLKEV